MKSHLSLLSIVCLFLSACAIAAQATPTPTPAPSTATATATRVPPTATTAPTATKAPTATPRPPTATPTLAPTLVPTKPPAAAKPPVAVGGAAIAEIARGNTARPQVALTFDAGASSRPTPKILDTLRAHKLRVTLFITGDYAQKNPELLRQMAADGHELANHSYSHPDFVNLSDQQIQEELRRTEDTVQKITGSTTKPFFRAPFGSRNARTNRVIAEAGYRSIYWTLDSGDWVEGAIPSNVRQKVVAGVSNGSIVVNHLGSEATAEILDEIINGIQNKGFSIVPVSQLIAP
ncbi:MAG: polysaccharide deacetylase family protein [Chloroflexi bacterium]|nr:polysaccharide deacetylase family protein [Chloroflexota bacterium]